MNPRRFALLFAAAVVVALVHHFGKACLPGWWLVDKTPGGDTYFLATIYERWAAQVAHGHAPLWFPDFAAGSPVHAAWMYGLAYPPLLLFALLPPETAWTWLAILHIAFGAFGMYAFLRGEEHDEYAAATGAVVFAFSGFLLGRVGAGHLNLVMPLAWAPWVLFAAARCVRGVRGATALLGLCAGLGAIAGHVQVFFYVAPLAVAFAIAEMRRLGAARSALPRLALAAVLAIGVSAIQWWPTLELVRLGGMVTELSDVVAQGSADFRGLAAQLWPSWIEDSSAPFRHEYLGLAGPLAVGAVVASAFLPVRRRWFWLSFAALGLLLATGPRNPVGEALNSIPPFRFGRAPGRAMALVVIAAAPLVAGVVSSMRKASPWVLPFAFGICGLTTVTQAESVRADFYFHPWAPTLPAQTQGHRVNVAESRYPFLEREGVRTLRDVCPVATPGWRTFLGDTSPSMAWWFDVGAQVTVPWEGAPPQDRAGTQALLPRSRVQLLDPGGRASFFASSPAPTGAPEIVARMDRGERVLCVHPSATDDSCRAWATLADAAVREVPEESPSEMAFDVEARSPGFVFVSECWYPGWESSVDGGATWRPAERANLAFLAVEVSGRARVLLRYRPAWFVPAALVSAATLVAALAFAMSAKQHRSLPL